MITVLTIFWTLIFTFVILKITSETLNDYKPVKKVKRKKKIETNDWSITLEEHTKNSISIDEFINEQENGTSKEL